MGDEQLFDYDLPPERRKSVKPEATMVPRPPGYHAVTNSKGAQGFHRTKVTSDLAKYGAVQTLCGITGRRIGGYYPKEVPLCEECEQNFQPE